MYNLFLQQIQVKWSTLQYLTPLNLFHQIKISVSVCKIWVFWWWLAMSLNLALHKLQTPLYLSLTWLYLCINNLANWLKLFWHCKHLKKEEDFSKVWCSLLCLSSRVMEEAWTSQTSHLNRPLSSPSLFLPDEFLVFTSQRILPPLKSKINN